jgi:hypothetical protein
VLLLLVAVAGVIHPETRGELRRARSGSLTSKIDGLKDNGERFLDANGSFGSVGNNRQAC